MRRTVLLALLLAGWATAAAGQPSSGIAAKDRDVDPRLLRALADTALRTGRLPNGLTYYVRRGFFLGHAELRLVVRAGSALEGPDQRGAAHLLEHMAFNGTRRFPGHEILAFLERQGMRMGPDLNAYTSPTETVYRLTIPGETEGALEHGLDVMADWASAIALDPAELAREQGVVIEEWRSGRGAEARVHDRESALLWAGSPYARPVLGDPDSIRTLDAARLERFHRDWYRPDLMAVVAVGELDVPAVEQMIRDRFGSLAAPPDAPPHPEPAVPLGRGPRVHVSTDPELVSTRIRVCWMRPAAPLLTARARMDDLAARMFASMLGARLEEAAERPDAPFLGAGVAWNTPLRPVRQLCIGALAAEGGAARALAGVLAEAERVARDGFTAPEWAREKEDRDRRSLAASSFRVDPREAADAYVEAYLSGEPPVLPSARAGFDLLATDRLGVADANAQARVWLRAPDRVVLVSAPESVAGSLPTEARLAQVADSAAAAEPAPYTSAAAGAAARAVDLPPGRIVAEDSIPAVGVVRWELSNGARVVLRQWGNGGVRLRAASPGGLSLVPDSLFLDALLSPGVVQAGGLGSLPAAQLQRRMEAAEVQLVPFVEATSEGLAGWTGEDVEELLYLAHLYFTAPRLDTASWGLMVRRMEAALQGWGTDPAQAFADTLQSVLGADDPRTLGLRPEAVAGVDPARALRVFRERFADASDFTFYLAGWMDPKEVRPLVERYLASLPSSGTREAPRDLGVRPPAGITRRTVRAGREALAVVAVVFSGEAPFTRESRAEVEAVAAMLQHRLQARLRGELGLVYDQEVDAWSGSVPVPSYRVALAIPAAPERLEEVARVVLEEADSLRRHGGSDEQVQHVSRAAQREFDERYSETGFWVEELRTATENGWSLRTLREEPVPFTRDRMRKAARRYLDPGRYVQVMLVPADHPASAAEAAPRPRE